MKDNIGDRMKEQYENRTRYFLPRRTYTIIRLDGKAFHTYTRHFERPFDKKFTQTMDETAEYLLNNIQGASLAYVQSDEISLLLTDFETIQTDAWFNGNIQKIVSVSAAMASSYFNYIIESKNNLALFDSRTFTIPDKTEVKNYFIWRQKDNIRNSIQMLAQSLYSHKELTGKTIQDQHDMIHEKNKNWAKEPDRFKNGNTLYKSMDNKIIINSEIIFTQLGPGFDEIIPEYK